MANWMNIDETSTTTTNPNFVGSQMEVNKHSKLITILSDEYVRMITKSSTQQPLRFRKKKDFVNKIRKFVSGHKVPADTTTVGLPTTTSSVKTEDIFNDKESNEDSKTKRSLTGCLGKEFCWWEPPEKNLPLDFCRDTSLHGLKYIGQAERHMSERIFWFVAFLSGLILAIVLISDVWNKYNSSPIIVSFQSPETGIDQIPFPAVTVCNMNKILKTKANSYIKLAKEERSGESTDDVFYLDHVCSATKSFTKRFNYSYGRGDIFDTDLLKLARGKELTKVNEFLRKASQNCSDMIRLCLWQDESINCSLLFRPIETEFGKCCTFNMVPQSVLYTLRNDERDDPEEIGQWKQWHLGNDDLLLSGFTNKFPRRQMQAGKTFGLSFMLNPALDEYYCTTSDSTGFRMATHLPMEIPHVTDFGISVRPRAEVFVNVRPEMTMVDQSIFKFDLQTRKCYKFGEFTLKYYNYYTLSNCIDECIANQTMELCQCKRYYMPRDDTQALCGGNQTSFECAENVKINMTRFGAKNGCKNCHASCTELDYQSQTTTTPLQTGIWVDSENSVNSWDSESVSIVHVFFGVDSTYSRVRKELFGSTDLFANTGGLMGLCLGFSGLSAMEVIYFLTLRAYWSSRRQKNVTQRVAKRFRELWAKTKALRLKHKGNADNVGDMGKHKPEIILEEQKPSGPKNMPEILNVQPANVSQNRKRIQDDNDQYKDLTKQMHDMNYKNILGDIQPAYSPQKY